MTKKVKAQANQNIVDVALQAHGNVRGLLDLWRAESIDTLTPDVASGDEFSYDPAIAYGVDHVDFATAATTAEPTRELIFKKRQNLFDVAIMAYGGAEGIVQLAFENDFTLSAIPVTGYKFKATGSRINEKVYQYLASRAIVINTGNTLPGQSGQGIFDFTFDFTFN